MKITYKFFDYTTKKPIEDTVKCTTKNYVTILSKSICDHLNIDPNTVSIYISHFSKKYIVVNIYSRFTTLTVLCKVEYS